MSNTAGGLVIAGIAGGIAGAAVTAMVFISTGNQITAVDELRAEFDKSNIAIDAKIATIQDQSLQQSQFAEISAEMQQHQQTAQQRFDGLDERTDELASQLHLLQQELAQAQSNYRAEITALRGARAKAAAAALATREIAHAIEAGQSFVQHVEQLNGILDEDTKLGELTNALREHANGVASIERLTISLDTIRVNTANASGQNPTSWVNRTVDNLRALINVEGLPELAGTDGMLREAREQTAKGRLDDAIAVLEPLANDIPDLPTWIEMAQARLSAESLLAAIDRHLDERLSRQG